MLTTALCPLPSALLMSISLTQEQGTGLWPSFILGASALGYSVLERFENALPSEEKPRDGGIAYADLEVKTLERTGP